MGDSPFLTGKVDMPVYSYRLEALWAMLVHDSTAPRLAINSQNPLEYMTGMLVVDRHISSEASVSSSIDTIDLLYALCMSDILLVFAQEMLNVDYSDA
jgi:hypothetical protein